MSTFIIGSTTNDDLLQAIGPPLFTTRVQISLEIMKNVRLVLPLVMVTVAPSRLLSRCRGEMPIPEISRQPTLIHLRTANFLVYIL